MASARPLRDVFTDLAGAHPTSGDDTAGYDPADVLAAGGHAGLPDGLVAEAVVNYADTAPIEVAQHLAPFVMANSPVPLGPETPGADEPAGWLAALTSAPVVTVDHDPTAVIDPQHAIDPVHVDHGPVVADHGGPGDLDFGGGFEHPGPHHSDPQPSDPHHAGADDLPGYDHPTDLTGHEAPGLDEPFEHDPHGHGLLDHDPFDHDGGLDHDPGHLDDPHHPGIG